MNEIVDEENHHHCVLLAHPTFWRHWLVNQEVEVTSGMNGPQLENGYLKIANELFDALIRTDFSKRQIRVLLFIVRKTYGYGKKTDDMTVQQIANGTGLARQNVSTTINELVALNAVSKQDGAFGYVLGINKNYGEWLTVSKQDTSQNKTETVSKQDGDRLKTRHTKDNSKRQLQKRERASAWLGGENVPDDWIVEAEEKYRDTTDWWVEGERFVSKHQSKGSKFKDWKQAWWSWCNTPYPKAQKRAVRKVVI